MLVEAFHFIESLYFYVLILIFYGVKLANDEETVHLRITYWSSLDKNQKQTPNLFCKKRCFYERRWSEFNLLFKLLDWVHKQCSGIKKGFRNCEDFICKTCSTTAGAVNPFPTCITIDSDENILLYGSET